MKTIDCCRACDSQHLQTILSLGQVPVADHLIPPERIREPIPEFPLTLAFCPDCALVQILETLPPEELFANDYPYYSSFSDDLVNHSRANALRLMDAESLDQDSLVLEVASNDGYLLRHFVEFGVPVLGIDPAEGPVRAARKIGIPTIEAFFSQPLAEQWRSDGRLADVLIANNVLAHVADTTGFVEGVRAVLKPTGVACLEFPYVRDLIDGCEFDTIYHQHLCYFSLTSVKQLMERAGLVVHDVQRLPIHGGSLRLHVSHNRKPSPSVQRLLAEEQAAGLTEIEYYRGFASRVRGLCSDLRALIADLSARHGRIAAYGAAAKGTTLLSCLDLPRGTIEYVVDRNVHKHGRWLPANRIPIQAVERLASDRPDYVLLLTWNFRAEILRQQRMYRQMGGRFIVPIPEIQVI